MTDPLRDPDDETVLLVLAFDRASLGARRDFAEARATELRCLLPLDLLDLGQFDPLGLDQFSAFDLGPIEDNLAVLGIDPDKYELTKNVRYKRKKGAPPHKA